MTDPQPASLQGLDPGELLARGLHTARRSGGLQDWTPPTVEELSQLLPQYRIEGFLGRGGMGAVYKGWQEHLGRAVAIKLLPAELSTDDQFVARFQREARLLAALQHPNIVSVYDFGQMPDGQLYFVMEYVEGTDLRRVLQGDGLEPDRALGIIVQVCEALQAAHRQGVIHRDIKPANILLTSGDRVKLADFGLARREGELQEGLTCPNEVLGTPDYMAPEQRAGRPDSRTDIFALGVTLYEMLTGQVPRGAFVPPSKKVRVDVRVDEVVVKALQEEPERRYQQAGEMKSAVEQIRASEAGGKIPKRFVAIAVLLGAVAVAGGGLFLGRSFLTPSRQALESPPMEAAGDKVPAAREALLSTKWTLSSPYSRRIVVFAEDGNVRHEDGTATGQRWKAVGPKTFTLSSDSASTVLTFDEKFTRFQGRTLKLNGKLIGTPVTTSRNP